MYVGMDMCVCINTYSAYGCIMLTASRVPHWNVIYYGMTDVVSDNLMWDAA